MRNAVIRSIFFALCLLGAPQVSQAGSPEDDARAVFVQLVQAAKAKDEAAFKSRIVAKDLAEMEQMGAVPFMMEMMAEETPEAFKAEVNGDRVVFTKVSEEKSPDLSSRSETTVHMIKEGSAWKFGKP